MKGIHEFLTAINDAMGDQESLMISFARKNNGLDITIIPQLFLSEDEVPDAGQALRAALAAPLSFAGMSIQEIGEEFSEKLEEYAGARAQAQDALSELIESINDATANVRNIAASTSVTTPSTPQEESEQKTDNAQGSDDSPANNSSEEQSVFSF